MRWPPAVGRAPTHQAGRGTRQITAGLRPPAGQGTDPTLDELAQALEMSPADIADLLRAYRSPLSLDAPLTEEGDRARLDVLAAEHLPSSEVAYVSAAMRQEVYDLLARLEATPGGYPARPVWF